MNETIDKLVGGGIDGPPSTGSSSNNGMDHRKKVVINYADHVKQRKQSLDGGAGISDQLDELVSNDRSASNISIGHNHAPTSPMNTNRTPMNNGQGFPEWPTSNKSS